jgi:hypothetical protein
MTDLLVARSLNTVLWQQDQRSGWFPEKGEPDTGDLRLRILRDADDPARRTARSVHWQAKDIDHRRVACWLAQPLLQAIGPHGRRLWFQPRRLGGKDR